jgi:uncharacterized protein (DUF885 family)
MWLGVVLTVVAIGRADAVTPGPTPATPSTASAAPSAAPVASPNETKGTSVAEQSRRLTEFLDAQFDEYLALVPELALSMGIKVHTGEISDRSEAGDEKILQWRRLSVAQMQKQFDPAQLDDIARTGYDIWLFELTMDERRAQFRRYPYFLGGIFGAHTSLPRMFMTYQRVDDAADLDDYVARLRAIARSIDQLLERVQLAAGEGIRMPAFEYKKAIDSCRALTTGVPFTHSANSALYANARSKVDALVQAGKATPAQAQQFDANVRAALLDDFAPAYRRVIAWLEADASNAPTGQAGVGQLPNGRAWYDAALFLRTTTSMTADEIHAKGLAEVARIGLEMREIKTRTGFAGPMAEFFTYLRTDPRFFYPNTDAGRAQYMQRAEDYLDGMKPRLPAYFGLLPKSDLVVRRVESFREEAGGAANYSGPTGDGGAPGIFYVHLIDMTALPTWQLEAMAYHEGIPGHHLQIAIARELTGVPRVMTGGVGYTAFSEGWALYAEPLAKEMGFYTDPYSDFGRLVAEQWRAVRMVVDTGLHTKGWTEEQAVKYFLDNLPLPEAVARSEVERYITSPGQAVSYKVGMMDIQRLRDEAKRKLGDRFDYRRFHDVVLGVGAQPLPVLDARVERWLAAQGDQP